MFFPNYIEYLKANWNLLVLPYNDDFSDAYQLVHHAVQFLAISCKSIFPPRFDDSHTSFQWNYKQNCFTSDWMHFEHTMRMELCPESLTLRLANYKGVSISSFTLDNKTKMDVYSQLRQMLQENGIKMDRFVNEMHYDMPEHRVCKGDRFSIPDGKYNKELGYHYANAYILLRRLAVNSFEASEIRCWPHHFDITLNMPLRINGNEAVNNLTIGYSPANLDVPEPHYYIKLAEESNAIKISHKLRHASYFREAKTGTYLPLGSLLEKKTVNAQTSLLSNYLNESFGIFQEQLVN